MCHLMDLYIPLMKIRAKRKNTDIIPKLQKIWWEKNMKSEESRI